MHRGGPTMAGARKLAKENVRSPDGSRPEWPPYGTLGADVAVEPRLWLITDGPGAS